VRNTCLHAPGTKRLGVAAFANCDSPILVPYDFPIRFRSFAKEDPPHRKAIRAQNGSDKLFQNRRGRQISNGRNSQQIPLRVVCAANDYRETLQHCLIQTFWNYREAVAFNALRQPLNWHAGHVLIFSTSAPNPRTISLNTFPRCS